MNAHIKFIGIIVSSEKEFELLPNNKETGLNAEVVYHDGTTSNFYNLTEIHWMYPEILKEQRVAFESNIHCTGLTLAIKKIKSLNIEIATEVKESINWNSEKVIGYQVVKREGDVPEMHQEMEASFCVYSLSQAEKMLAGDEAYRIDTIHEGDIEEPTLMFEGDPTQ